MNLPGTVVILELFLLFRPSVSIPKYFVRMVLSAAVLTGMAVIPAWSQDGAHADGNPAPSATAGQGSIHGVVMNHEQAVYEGAQVELSVAGRAGQRSAVTDANGRFSFSGVPAGPFTLTASAAGFDSTTASGELAPGESYEAPALMLSIAEASSSVKVTASQEEIATEEVHLEEKQRVLGVIPNFYVVYDANPAPLTSKQKFSLAWRETIDPVTFLSAGFLAGIEQAQNTFAGYGQGARGFAKRYGADYADGFSSDMLGGAVFPSLLHQDPRNYYKGTGSVASRVVHAVAMSVLCKGDNGHWQFNYSALAGNVAAGGISNLFYPASDKNGFSVILTTTAIGMGESAVGNLFQEFVVRKLTPSARKQQ